MSGSKYSNQCVIYQQTFFFLTHEPIPFSATQKYWVVAGQHSFLASNRIRQQCIADSKAVPRWTTTFRCYIVKPEATVDDIEMLSGRVQAQTANTAQWRFSETLAKFLQLYQKEIQHTEPSKVSRSKDLIDTYGKTGKNTKDDGSPVCSC